MKYVLYVAIGMYGAFCAGIVVVGIKEWWQRKYGDPWNDFYRSDGGEDF